MATAESAVTDLYTDLEVEMVKVSNLESEKATLFKKYLASKTNVQTVTGRAKDLGGTRANLRKKRRECDPLRAIVSKLEKGLATLREVTKANE